MNMPDLISSLIQHEGYKKTIYTCTAGKPTIGVGHNLETPISDAAIMQILRDDIDDCIEDLDKAKANWRDHSETRQNVLVEMCFNLGMPRLKRFEKMWHALANKNYDRASDEMLRSGWAVQVGQRAKTLADRMRAG